MSEGPELELQGAIIAALRADAAVVAVVGAADRVMDAVKGGMATPYVTLGQPQVLSDDRAGCFEEAVDVVYAVHGWTTGPRTVESKRLGTAIRRALDEKEDFSLNDYRVVSCLHESTDYLDDPDGLTKHVVVTFRISTEPST